MGFRVLKLGWEFPPNNHGGLGVACEGLVKGLTAHGIHVLMVLPRQQKNTIEHCTFIATDEGLLKKLPIDSLLRPYSSSNSYSHQYHQHTNAGTSGLYGEHLFAEMERYAQIVGKLATLESFDIIHAHDWMAIAAGVLAKRASSRPLIVHMHATEFDRNGGNNVNQYVYNLERWGMEQADRVIAVSNFTKRKLVEHYGIDPDKITVIHNAISLVHHNPAKPLRKNNPLVLFLGRLTLQKGPDYFITAAYKILELRPEITFIVAGSGDMEGWLIDWVTRSGKADNILFTGQLPGTDVDRLYQAADLFIMPSVSEPFGLTALEAMRNGTPVIISKQSGVSEVINHCLKVDFWDIDQMVTKILSTLEHHELHRGLAENGEHEVKKFSWHVVAKKCIQLYQEVKNDA